MLEIKAVNYKVLLFRWIAGLFILLNIFAFSGAVSRVFSVNLTRTTTELKVVSRVVAGSKIFYKSFVDKLNRVYPDLISLESAFKNLVILKNNIVHVQFTTNSILVLLINFLIGFMPAVLFLFYPAHQKNESHTCASF
ncbi:hypothetical protein [Pedobacter foliorum]|uniref:hypothetical protein n=1 Tax=Pedobacter foliorum TaxID=2739058 RepID=UPI001565FFF4|nr:hypothetical protein [Pedobacter foliorum]NRF37998.1 hypothetical protein [Pedobacter foliorum]